MYPQFHKKATEKRQKLVNNVREKCLPDKKLPVKKLPDKKFDETETYYLNVPMSSLNNKNFNCNNIKIQEFTNEFMSELENTYSAMSNILTEGGLDGTIDKSSITVSDTKKLLTKKGELTVGSQLSDKMGKTFSSFVSDYPGKLFDNSTLGKTFQQAHLEIKADAKQHPAAAKYLPLNPFMREEAKKLVEKMVLLGVLEPTTKTANSTIFIVQKHSGKWRLICDLRAYNDRLQDHIVHLPSPYELINQICQFELFSYVDFPDAYFNIPLSKETVKNHPIVASVSGMQQNFQYLRMPQGLKTATSNFIHILNDIYQKVLDYVFIYLDDSVITSKDCETEHFTRLKRFFEITDKAGLRVSLPKSIFFTKNLSFLNFTISNKNWQLSNEQKTTIRALNSDNLTVDKRESLAAFLQFFNKFDTGVAYASRCIRDPKTSAKAISDILDNIKTKLINSPALKAVDFKSDLHTFVDASNLDCSAVIFQKNKNGKYAVVSCFSRKLPANIIDSDIYTKELWCLQQVKSKFRYLFIGNHKKTFYIDNKAVKAAEKSKAPSLKCLFNSIKAEFSNVKFSYVPSKKNASDIFTRQINNTRESERIAKKKTDILTPSLKDKILKIHANGGCLPAKVIFNTLTAMGHSYSFLNRSDIEKILTECTDCNDLKNHKKPRKSAPGITLSKEITCQDCVYIDHKKIITKHRENEMLDNDIEPEDGDYKSCLTVFEPVSGLTWFYPVQDYKEENVKIALRVFFMINGVSKAVVSDNAKSFIGNLSTWLEKEFNSKLHNTSIYHPNSNLSERAHREFEKTLKTYSNLSKSYNYANWMDCLTKACITTNSLKHATHNLSPYEIYKNRCQNDVQPVNFHPIGLEHRVTQSKLANKVVSILKSKLKVRLPIFKKGEQVKVDIPDEQVRFGIVTSTKDTAFKMAVKVKFDGSKSVSVNKNHICVPRNK